MEPNITSSSEVIITTSVTKDYDQETGHKILNNFSIIKEIGRGVHGKVKLAQDMNTGELVVTIICIFFFKKKPPIKTQ